MEPTETDIQNYIAQLTEQERKVYKIAKEHLETSFDMVRTIGFITWFKQKCQEKGRRTCPSARECSG